MLAECWLRRVHAWPKNWTVGMGDAVGGTIDSGSVTGTCSNAPDKLAETATMALAWDRRHRSRINRNRQPLLHKEEIASKLNDKRTPARLNGRNEKDFLCTMELVMFEIVKRCHDNRFRTAQGNLVQVTSLADARRHERSPYTTDSTKTSGTMTTGTRGDDVCDVNRPTLSKS